MRWDQADHQYGGARQAGFWEVPPRTVVFQEGHHRKPLHPLHPDNVISF